MNTTDTQVDEEFITYVLDYYGDGGIFDLKASREEVIRAINDRLTHPDIKASFEGDTIDREMVRHFIERNRA